MRMQFQAVSALKSDLLRPKLVPFRPSWAIVLLPKLSAPSTEELQVILALYFNSW